MDKSDEEYKILSYEIKQMDTMAKRISQMAFGRQREFKLLMNMLQQLDPDLLVNIGEKFYEYIQNTNGAQAGDLFRELALERGSTYGVSNIATVSQDIFSSEELIRKIVETANQFISHNMVLQLLNGWIYEHRIMTFVNLILDNIRIRDFASMLKHIIDSECSMVNIGGKGTGIFIATQILRHAAETDPLLKNIISEVHIDMFDDRLEIYSPGGMLDGSKIQNRDPMNIPSRRRNPVIADIFNRLKYMERRGSGFKKILGDYKLQGTYTEAKRPEFFSDNDSFVLILKNLNYKKGAEKGAEKGAVSQKQKEITERKEQLLVLVSKDPCITQVEMMNKLNISRKQVQSALKLLEMESKIERVGSNRNGHWKIMQ